MPKLHIGSTIYIMQQDNLSFVWHADSKPPFRQEDAKWDLAVDCYKLSPNKQQKLCNLIGKPKKIYDWENESLSEDFTKLYTNEEFWRGDHIDKDRLWTWQFDTVEEMTKIGEILKEIFPNE